MSGVSEQQWPNEGVEPTPRTGAAHAGVRLWRRMGEDSDKKLPLDMSLLFTAAITALAVGDFAKAWASTKRALECARNSEGPLDGRAFAAEIDRLLTLLDDRLCDAYGARWSQLIDVPGEVLPDRSDLRCSFCKRAADEVSKLIAGPRFYMCNECLDLCRELVHAQ
jgi:hypothetical protein